MKSTKIYNSTTLQPFTLSPSSVEPYILLEIPADMHPKVRRCCIAIVVWGRIRQASC